MEKWKLNGTGSKKFDNGAVVFRVVSRAYVAEGKELGPTASMCWWKLSGAARTAGSVSLQSWPKYF